MTETMILSIIQDAIQTGLMMAAPILGVALGVGLIISVFQATTQIQEQTLTFVPKLLAVAVVGLLTGAWMLNTIMNFTNRIFQLIANIVH